LSRVAERPVIADKYRLERKLGEGAHGVVYRARHLDLGVDVAIKLLQPQLAGDDRAERRFLREVYLATAFVHRYVVQVRDFGRDADHGCLYYTMDLVEGRTLDRLLRREGLLDAIRTIALATQALEGLEEAHDAGVVHRDLKPSNVLVTIGHSGLEEVRICDFGLAKAVSAAALEGGSAIADITMPGQQVGTLAYMSPEQSLGRELDRRSDLYTIGVLAYEALTGSRPCVPSRKRPDALQVFLLNLTSRPPRDPRELNREVPAELARVLLKALAKRPDDRFWDARSFREALHEAADQVVARPLGRASRSRRRPAAR